jgi:hypothetical protein
MHAITARRGLMAATSLAHGLSENLSRGQHECDQRLRRDPEHTWRRLRGKAIGIVRDAPERPPQATRSVGECDALMRPPTLSPAAHLENRHRRRHDGGQHQCASSAPTCSRARCFPSVALCRRRSSSVNTAVTRIRIRAISWLSVPHPGAFPVDTLRLEVRYSHSIVSGSPSSHGANGSRRSRTVGAWSMMDR